MNTLNTRTNWLTSSLLLAVIVMMGYQTFAMRPQPQLSPSVVATVDLEKVFNALDEKLAADAEFKKLKDQLFAERDARTEKVKQMQADLIDLQPGGPKYKELEDQTLLEVERLRAFGDFVAARLDAETSRTLKRLYLSIRKASDQLAKANGYDIVLVNDSIAEIPAGTSEEMTRQISARRVLYADNRGDVTAPLIAYMNAEYAKQQN